MSSFWTPKPHFRGGRAFLKDFKLGTCGLLCAFLLSSCGQSSPSGYGGSPESNVKTGTLEPLTVPPNAGDAPPKPGTTGAPKTPDGLPALQAKGANTALFSQKISSEADRIERLENAVQELRNDFDAVAPAIVRLVAIESDIQNLIKQLDVLTGNAPPPSDIAPIEEAALEDQQTPLSITPPIPAPPISMDEERSGLDDMTQSSNPQQLPAQEAVANPASVSAQTPEATPPAPMAASPPPVATPQSPAQIAASPPVAIANTSGIQVEAVRIGDHPGKVRIVLDVSGKTAFTADLDNQEKILVVELPQTGWNAENQKTIAGNTLISSYHTEKSDNSGTTLAFQLKTPATITYQGVMANPDGTSRIVIDIAKN